MKTGRSLQDLAAELARQQEAKYDALVPSQRMRAVSAEADAANDRLVMEIDGAKHGGRFLINSLAHDQIGTHYGIPSKYYDRMLAEAPGLLAANVNTWLARPAPSARCVRCARWTARCAHSFQTSTARSTMRTWRKPSCRSSLI